MPRAKKDQLTNDERERVDALEDLYVKAQVPARQARRRARVAVSDTPTRRHQEVNERNAEVGAAVAKEGGKARAQKLRTGPAQRGAAKKPSGRAATTSRARGSSTSPKKVAQRRTTGKATRARAGR